MKQVKWFAILCMAIGLSGCSSTLAFLDEDEEGKTFEQRAIQDSLATVGVLPRAQKPIEYKERKPLKMVASQNLPEPAYVPEAKDPSLRTGIVARRENVAMKAPDNMSYEEMQVGKGSGLNLVRSVETNRSREANPSDLNYGDWRAGEDVARQNDMRTGAPVQGYNSSSALDWEFEKKQLATGSSKLDLNALKTADRSRKTVYDPPSQYRAPAPMDHLTADEIAKVEQIENKKTWWPF